MEAIFQHCAPVSLPLENELKVPTEYTPDDPLRGVGSNTSPPPTDIERHHTSPQPDISLPVINTSLFNWFSHMT